MTMRATLWSIIGFTAFWLLLVNDISAGQAALGALLAMATSLSSRALATAAPLPVRRVSTALRLAGLFAYDIVVANVSVARAVLSPRLPIAPRIVRVPLDTHEPKAVALLAAMVTLTPGTVSVDLAEDLRTLEVHVLLPADPDAVVRDIKERYEARIKEIFQC